MRGVSKRVINAAGAALVVATIVVQPAFAAAKTPNKGIDLGSLIQHIIRALDEIRVGLPPG